MLEWNDRALIQDVEEAVDKATEKGAEAVQADAKRILMATAKHPTGHLAREIDVVASKFENGGHMVYAQGPGHWSPPYHAIFVELGTHKMAPIPYLRPALKQNKKKILNSFEGILR